MTTALLTRPHPRPEPETAAGSAPGSTQPSSTLLGPYLGYIGYFVGAGLISGSVVHYPLDPARYALIGAAGVLTFLLATILNEFILPRQRPAGGQLLRIVGGSLLLSMGIGMLSGGIQHFNEFPTRSAVLVPAGLVGSFLAYIVRYAPHRTKAILGPIGIAVVTTAVLAFAALNYLAQHSAPAEHGHGEVATTVGEHVEQPAATDTHTGVEKPANATTPGVEAAPGARQPKRIPKVATHDGQPHGADGHHG